MEWESPGPLPVLPLAAQPGRTAAIASSRLAEGARAWCRAWLGLRHGPLHAAASDMPSPEDCHSLILLGYANAMYRLGWRYEIGNGTARNAEEAVRCYFKAAKLGNAAALARLAPQRLAGTAPRPSETADQVATTP